MVASCAAHPAITTAASAQGRPNGGPSTRLEAVNRTVHRWIAKPRHRHDLHHLDAFFVQPNDLFSPFVQLLQGGGLVSRVFFLCHGFTGGGVVALPVQINNEAGS